MTHTVAKTWSRSLLTALLSAGLVAPTARAADAPPAKPAAAKPNPADPAPPVTPEAVEASIRKAVAYIYKQQKGDNWETAPQRKGMQPADINGAQWGGLTAIATYALLAAGESPQNPQVSSAIKWLEAVDTKMVGTYAMGMKLQIWNYIERPTDAQKRVISKDATLLMNAVKLQGKDSAGMYHYFIDPNQGNYDHSTSNYGVLGMWAAAQRNVDVPLNYWKLVDAAWRRNQNKDGGWSYMKDPQEGHPVNLSMSAAGVATLFITQDMLNATAECKGNIVDPHLDAGLKWLTNNYAKSFAGGVNLYAMYNVERVGTASGYKYFGTTDWYQDGAARLIRAQKADGSWESGYGFLPATAWGILFLVKGRAPVMMNKLEYALADKANTPGHWNQRPRDIANLARWAGAQLEKELNWQIVNLKVSADDLHDAPILYMSGNQVLTLSQEDRAKLKQYVQQGGLILGHADCQDRRFGDSFMKLGQELFNYEWRDLPADHLIYNAHYSAKQWGGKLPTVRGLSNGARELMLLIPTGDPARNWHVKNFSTRITEPLAQLATNIYLYALDKSELMGRFKGQTYIVHRNDKVPTKLKVKVARLDYGGNWDPEPAGWRRLADVLHNERGVDLAIEPVKIGAGTLKSDQYKVAHLTGTQRLKLTAEQKQELKAFVETGGTLLVDAAGGSGEFKDGAENELRAIFPDAAKSLEAPLPPEHPVYSAGGDKITDVAYRPFARKLLVSGLAVPRLRGIDVKGRTGVYYSPEDLSVGLVGMSMDGIYGYAPADATDLVKNIVLANLGAPVPPRLTPATKPTPDKSKARPQSAKK